MASTQQLLLGEGAGGAEKNYIEDVFSTYLYTGTGANQTITNDIDLSTEGGLVWMKCRNAAFSHMLYDTSRGVQKSLSTNKDIAQQPDNSTEGLKAFNTNGFNLGVGDAGVNASGYTYASWTFRKQPKFFDVVTYTGTGGSQTINHDLGSTPGCIIVKRTSDTEAWYVYHRSLNDNSGDPYSLVLNTTAAQDTGGGYWGTPTSTQFTVKYPNAAGQTYVAYLFAHDAGGFGLTGTDSVISCGSVTVADGTEINLGYEPQWILAKKANGTGNWFVFDTMRGWTNGDSGWTSLSANTSSAESAYGGAPYWVPTATGIKIVNGFFGAGAEVIYIAIRKGPMKVPTDATTVYGANLWNGGSTTFNTFAPDLSTRFQRTNYNTDTPLVSSRLQGSVYLKTSSDAVEDGGSFTWNNAGGGALVSFGATTTLVSHFMKRAPSFFDVVCYTGTGTSGSTINHNLGVAPEMIIVKSRSVAGTGWAVYHQALGVNWFLTLQGNDAPTNVGSYWGSSAPTTSVFGIGANGYWNNNGNEVAYLFATCAGVSKVGSYTGTGTTKQVDCGFAAGARFVLIKRTDSTGDWYVWDTARGIVSGNDPYLLLNSTAAEVTSTDYIDTYSAGFEISSTAPAAINASGGTFIFLAIA